MKNIILRDGKEKSVLNRHPWIFSGAILKKDPAIAPGEIVLVLNSKEKPLAIGYFNPASSIAIRLLEWDTSRTIDESWWEEKIRGSIERRKGLRDSGTVNALRLVYGESDFIPGLIVDQYGETVVIQSLTAGIEVIKTTIARIINDILKPESVYERSDADVRELEGLKTSSGLLAGKEPPDDIEVFENFNRYYVNVKAGQKTGFFLDQRDNRKIISSYASGRTVLDCFCYTGGFSIASLRGGALSVTAVDSSADAIAGLKKNFALNQNYDLKTRDLFTVNGDVFDTLRKFRDGGRMFDLIILDPPKLAPTKASLDKALRAYKDANLHALKILNPNGLLATFSCSGGVSSQDFQMMVGWAAKDAGRDVQIIRTLTQAEDHPVRVSYPESAYLKGLICRVI